MAGSSELELVTGYRGKAHVTADDARSYNAGTVGKGTYVLPEGDELAAEMVDSNTLRIQSGTLLAQGCQCRVRSGEYVDVKIRNGSQAMRRNDIVVARYEKQVAEPRTESMTLKVIEGTPTDGTAKDPDHVEGDILAGDLVAEFPLWRVPLDGITVGAPVPLYKKLVTLESIGESVSQLAKDTGWRNLWGNIAGNDYVSYRCVGSVVELKWAFTQGTTEYWNAGTLPVGFRPSYNAMAATALCDSSSNPTNNVAQALVSPAGLVRFRAMAALSKGRNIGYMTYLVAKA